MTFVAGYNQPGYLPDGDCVVETGTFDEAREYLKADAGIMLAGTYAEDNPAFADAFLKVIEALDAATPDKELLLACPDGYVYWIEVHELRAKIERADSVG